MDTSLTLLKRLNEQMSQPEASSREDRTLFDETIKALQSELARLEKVLPG